MLGQQLPTSRIIGFGLVMISAAGFGTLAVLGRFAYADGMNAQSILFLRFSLAAVLMLALLRARREALPRGPVLLRLIAMGAVGYVGQAMAYLLALKYASAGLVALLLYLYPIFVTLLAVLLLHEPFTGIKGLALGLALAGVLLTVGPLSGQALGILLAISGAVIYAVYIIMGAHVMRQVSAVQSAVVIFMSAGLSAGLLMLLTGVQLPATGSGWATIIAIVLAATVLPVVTFLAGLERVGPTTTAIFSVLEPVVTVLLASWWLHETLMPIALLGGGLILLAVLLVAYGELHRVPRPVTEDRAGG